MSPGTTPASNQIAAIGQNTPAPTNNFDMQLGERTKDWEVMTVAVKCSKCVKARMTELVEGKAMAAAATRDAGKSLLTVENVQEAVVKALATQAPAAAAFAGMHEFERGNGFGLGEHTAFGAIAEARVRLPMRRCRRARALGRITTADRAEGQAEGLIRPQHF